MNKKPGFKLDPNKPIEEYTEQEIKEMFLRIFFWVAENRNEWLEEAIDIRKAALMAAQLEKQKMGMAD